jgi:hypothetical protein
MSYIKNKLRSCRECGYEIHLGDQSAVLLYTHPVTGDEDWICSRTCEMGFAGVDYEDLNPDGNFENPGFRIGE